MRTVHIQINIIQMNAYYMTRNVVNEGNVHVRLDVVHFVHVPHEGSYAGGRVGMDRASCAVTAPASVSCTVATDRAGPLEGPPEEPAAP